MKKRAIELDFDEREVHHWCDSNKLATRPFASTEDYCNIVRVIGDVLIGDDDAGWIDDEAGAVGPHSPGLAASFGRRPQFPQREVYHRRQDPLQHSRVTGVDCASCRSGRWDA